MDKDPDNLATAFVAHQSTREEAMAMLPINNWTHTIAEALCGASPLDDAMAAGVRVRGLQPAGTDNNNDARIISSTFMYTKQFVTTMIIRMPDFIPLMLEKGLKQMLQDEMVTIPDGAAVAIAQSLAKNEGILTIQSEHGTFGFGYIDGHTHI
jgi:hypothetical protein